MTDSFRNMMWMWTDREWPSLVIDNRILSLSFITTKEVVHIQTNAPLLTLAWDISQVGFIEPKVSVMIEELVFTTWSDFLQLIVFPLRLCRTLWQCCVALSSWWAVSQKSSGPNRWGVSPQSYRRRAFVSSSSISPKSSTLRPSRTSAGWASARRFKRVSWTESQLSWIVSRLCFHNICLNIRVLVKTHHLCQISWVRLYCSGLHLVCGSLSFCFTSFRGKSLHKSPHCWRSCAQPSEKVRLWTTAVTSSLLCSICVVTTWTRTLCRRSNKKRWDEAGCLHWALY